MLRPMQSARSSLVALSLLALCACDRGSGEPASSSTGAQGPVKARVAAPEVPKAPKAKTEIVFSTNGGEKRVSVEVVHNPATIQRGLMHRQHLPPDHGMLFVFASDRVRSFWMKNTLISLDMLFVRVDGSIAGIERDTTPLSLESRSVGIATRYVLEVNGGWTAKHGIEAGSILRIENLPKFSDAPL